MSELFVQSHDCMTIPFPHPCILHLNQGLRDSSSSTRRRLLRRRSLLQSGNAVTVYYDVGGVPSGQAASAADQLAAAGSLQDFARLLQQAGARSSHPCWVPTAVQAGSIRFLPPSVIC